MTTWWNRPPCGATGFPGNTATAAPASCATARAAKQAEACGSRALPITADLCDADAVEAGPFGITVNNVAPGTTLHVNGGSFMP